VVLVTLAGVAVIALSWAVPVGGPVQSIAAFVAAFAAFGYHLLTH
jgi:hypothetical protein